MNYLTLAWRFILSIQIIIADDVKCVSPNT